MLPRQKSGTKPGNRGWKPLRGLQKRHGTHSPPSHIKTVLPCKPGYCHLSFPTCDHCVYFFLEQIVEEEEAMLPELGAGVVTAKAPGTDEEADDEEDISFLQQVLFQARLVSTTT